MPESLTNAIRPCHRAELSRLADSLRFDTGDADAWCSLGNLLAELGDRAGALLALRTALRFDAERAAAHVSLGRLLFDSGQVERALDCFDNALRLGRGNAGSATNYPRWHRTRDCAKSASTPPESPAPR